MTRIALVRHGQTDWNKVRRIQGITDIPLNAVGRQQAADAALNLQTAEEPWQRIVSSPLSRARETGDIIAEALGLDNVALDPSFQEREYGKAEGLTVDERAIAYPDGNVPGVEQPAAVLERTLKALKALSVNYPDERIVVTTHGGVISTLLRGLTNNAIPRPGMMIANGSVNTISIDANGDITIEDLQITGNLAEYDFVTK